jgi:hypothetical protein
MSMFENRRFRWRETYFVLFDAKKRPMLKNVTKTLAALNKRFELTDLGDDGRGYIDSLTLIAPDDFAALDICYAEGPEAREQNVELVAEMKKLAADQPPVPWAQIQQYDGRFDVLHFEQIAQEDGEESEDEEMLDPGALLAVLGALANLTGGIAVDPQSGTFFDCAL